MRLLNSLAALLFPPHCAFCGKVGVRGVCSDCEKTLPYCKTPFHERAEIGACLAPLRYEGVVREALLAYKFHESQSRCTGFGDILAQSVAEHFGGQFDLVTFVPVSKKRRRERGYDQSYLLARETCRHWDTAPAALLQKTRDNPAQSSLSSTISSPRALRCAKPRAFYAQQVRRASSARPWLPRTKTDVSRLRTRKSAALSSLFPYFSLIPCGKSYTMLLQTQFRAAIMKPLWESVSFARLVFRK